MASVQKHEMEMIDANPSREGWRKSLNEFKWIQYKIVSYVALHS